MAVTFKEAIEWALSRKVVLPAEYSKLLPKRLKAKAFTIAGITSRDQLQMVLDSLAAVLVEGGTYASWLETVQSGEQALKLPLSRLDNIFRTNMQVHYNRGHWAQQEAHKQQRPFLMYDAVNDSRVRPSHLKLDEVIKSIDDPFWETYYPPNGFRCRCSTIALTAKQVEARGGVTRDSADEWPEPDKGWNGHFGKDPDQGIREAKDQPDDGSDLLHKVLLTRLQKGE